MNPVKWPCSSWLLIAKWIECLPGVREVMGTIPRTQIFSLSHTCVMLFNSPFTFHYQAQNLPSLLMIYHYSRWLWRCWSTYELSKVTLLFMSSCSSLNRVPTRCSGGHGFDSCQDSDFFLCSTLVSCWSIQPSHFITDLKIHHLY